MKPRHNGIAEYVSRRARMRLLGVLMERVGSLRRVASLLGVSHTAVERWLGGEGPHPSNPSLLRMLELALRLDRRRTIEILAEDLEIHESLLRALGGNRGVAARRRSARIPSHGSAAADGDTAASRIRSR
jgi:predicted transcriptional regulator